MNEYTLNKLKIGETSQIKEIDSSLSIKERLYDIGIKKGVEIECLFKSPLNDPTAYFFKNTIVALRNSDASKIIIGEING